MCKQLGFCRDAYYKKTSREKDKTRYQAEVLELVKKERIDQPRMGGKKLYNEISDRIKESGISCGRDRLFDLLRQEELLIERKNALKEPHILIILTLYPLI